MKNPSLWNLWYLYMRNFGKIQMPITLNLVVSMTKFSIVIGSTNAYLLRNRRTNPWASIYEHPISISAFSNWISVIRCQRNVLVNKLRWIAVPYSLKVAEHSFRALSCWCNSARAQARIAKPNMPLIQRSSYLLKARSIFTILLRNWTQCVDGFSLL